MIWARAFSLRIDRFGCLGPHTGYRFRRFENLASGGAMRHGADPTTRPIIGNFPMPDSIVFRNR